MEKYVLVDLLMFDQTASIRCPHAFGAISRETCSLFEEDTKPPTQNVHNVDFFSLTGQTSSRSIKVEADDSSCSVLFLVLKTKNRLRSQVVNQKQSEL